jgi:uncharacterized membrane protein
MGSMAIGMWGFGSVLTGLLVAGVAVVAGRRDRNDARWLLEQRFARGEIDEQEYERRRRALEEAR